MTGTNGETMAMGYYDHDFLAIIERHGVGKSRIVTYRVLFLPAEVESALPFEAYPRVRVVGEIDDVPVRGAWMPTGDGRRYFIVSPDVIRSTGKDVGAEVHFRFRVDDQDFVDVPAALSDALASDSTAGRNWAALSAGKKRLFAFHVAGAKTPATAARRIEEALDAIRRECSLRDLKRRDR